MPQKILISKEDIEKELLTGKTIKEIAEVFKCSFHTIKKKMYLYGLKTSNGNQRRYCKVCGKELTGHQSFYCSKQCKVKWFWDNKRNAGSIDKSLSYHSDRARKRKFDLIKERGGKCEICGYAKNLAALCFHHKNPSEKEFILHSRTIGTRSLDLVKKEADKCLLLCHNCHMEIHYENWNMSKLKEIYKNEH